MVCDMLKRGSVGWLSKVRVLRDVCVVVGDVDRKRNRASMEVNNPWSEVIHKKENKLSRCP